MRTTDRSALDRRTATTLAGSASANSIAPGARSIVPRSESSCGETIAQPSGENGLSPIARHRVSPAPSATRTAGDPVIVVTGPAGVTGGRSSSDGKRPSDCTASLSDPEQITDSGAAARRRKRAGAPAG